MNEPSQDNIWIKLSEYEKMVTPYILDKTKLEQEETGHIINVWLIHASKPPYDVTKGLQHIGKVTRTSKNTLFTYMNLDIAPVWRFKKVPSWWHVDVGYDVYKKINLPASTALRSEDVYVFIPDNSNDIYISHEKKLNMYGH